MSKLDHTDDNFSIFEDFVLDKNNEAKSEMQSTPAEVLASSNKKNWRRICSQVQFNFIESTFRRSRGSLSSNWSKDNKSS